MLHQPASVSTHTPSIFGFQTPGQSVISTELIFWLATIELVVLYVYTIMSLQVSHNNTYVTHRFNTLMLMFSMNTIIAKQGISIQYHIHEGQKEMQLGGIEHPSARHKSGELLADLIHNELY